MRIYLIFKSNPRFMLKFSKYSEITMDEQIIYFIIKDISIHINILLYVIQFITEEKVFKILLNRSKI